MHKRVLSHPNSAQHRARTNDNTNDNLLHDLLHSPIDTRRLRPREVKEPQYAEGRRRVAHRSVALQTACKCLCGGETMRGDAQAEGELEGGWSKTEWAIAAAVESAYRVDLKRANPDPALLDGDDKGGEGRRGG